MVCRDGERATEFSGPDALRQKKMAPLERTSTWCLRRQPARATLYTHDTQATNRVTFWASDAELIALKNLVNGFDLTTLT